VGAVICGVMAKAVRFGGHLGIKTGLSTVHATSWRKVLAHAVFLLFLLQVPQLFASCQTLTVSHNMSDAEGGNLTALGTCFTLNADNITLDCKGYKISVTGATLVPAIEVNAANTTIQNCVVNDTYGTSIAMGAIRLNSNAGSTQIINTTVSSIGRYSLYVLSQGNNFTDDRFTTTAQTSYGGYFLSSSNNVFTNVVFNKTAAASSYALYYYGGDGNVFSNVTVDASNTRTTAIYPTYLYGLTNSNFSDSRFYSYNLQSVWLASSSGNRFNNVTIHTNSTSAAHGFYLSSSASNSILNSNINVSGVGVYILSSSGGTLMENLSIYSNASSGIYVEAISQSDANVINNVTSVALNYPLSFFRGSNYNLVGNSTFISISNTAFFASLTTTDNSFINNIFQSRLSGGAAYAFHFTSGGDNNVFRNNNITSPTSHAIYFPTVSTGNIIDSNTINAPAGTGYGIYFVAASSVSNSITNNNITASGYGIQIYGNDNSIINNSIIAYTTGIYLPTGTSLSVIGNNITSATTLGVNIASGASVSIVGNSIQAVTYGVAFTTVTSSNISNNIMLTNNTAAANAVVYLSGSNGNTIFNNTLLHTGTVLARNYGVLVSASGSNTFNSNNISTFANDAVRVTSTNSNYNIFTNNIIYTNATAYYGIQVTTSCENNRFYDNNITSLKGAGLIFTSNSLYNVFSGGNIDAYTQAGVTINVGSNNNTLANTTIRSGIGAAGSYGLTISASTGNRILSSSITANASQGIYLTAYANTNLFDNVTASSRTSNALYAYAGASSNTFSNFNFTSSAAIAVYLSATNPVFDNRFTNGSIWANVSSSAALSLYLATSNRFTNVSVENNGSTGARAIDISTSSTSNIFREVTAIAANAANSYGVYALVSSTNNYFYNSGIIAPYPGTGYDISLSGTSSVMLINSSFGQFDIYFVDTTSSINVSWYLRANLTDLSGDVPVEGANVTLYNKNGALISSSLTDSGGFSSWAESLQYKRSAGGGTILYYPYNFTVTVGSAQANSILNFTSSTIHPISINASICKYVNTDYVLTNNVFSSAGCFQVGGSYITLDCNGYTVNYSRTGAGCAFYADQLIGLNVKNCRFVQGAYGSNSSSAFCLSNSNATIANTTISAAGEENGYVFNLTSGATAYALNVTTNQSNNYFSDNSRLYRQWYTQVNLTDLSGAPLPSARVNITDAFGSRVASENVADGLSPVMILVQYMQTGASNYTQFSNFTVLGYTGASSSSTLLNLTNNAMVNLQLNVSNCGVVSESTVLRNNLYTSGTCLVAGANGVTIDCAGYSVNYSRSGNGFYGLDTARYDNIIVKNCNFVSGNVSADDSYGIFMNGSLGTQVVNSSILGKAAAFYLSTDTHFLNTTFDNETFDFQEAISNLTVQWYANVHVIGLADEDINGSAVNVSNSGGPVASAIANANGRASFILPQYSRNQSGSVYYDPYNFTAVHPVTMMTATNYTNLSSSLDITLRVTSAEIEIESPVENEIYFQGNKVNITINVILGQSWVTNTTVQVTGDSQNLTYQAVQVSPGKWHYNYSIDPAQPSATLTINARGYNGDSFVSATRHFIVTRSTNGSVDLPVVNYVCPLYTFGLVNDSTNVTAVVDLDTVLYTMTLTLTDPEGNNVTPPLIDTNVDLTRFIYNYTWRVNTTQSGSHTLTLNVRDASDNRANASRLLYASPSNVSINLSSNSISSLSMKDVCSGVVVHSGASLQGVSAPPGNYSLLAVDTGKVNLTFNNFNITSYSGTFLNYSRESASGLPTPENRRNIFLVSGAVNGGSFSSVGIAFDYQSAQVMVDYSGSLASLVSEAALEVWHCPSVSDCTNKTRLSTTVNTISHTIRFDATSLSGVYGVYQPSSASVIVPIQVPLPQITRLSPSKSIAVRNDNITVYLDLQLGANLSSVALNLTRPSGSWQLLDNSSFVSGSNHTYNLTYWFIANNETGYDTLSATVFDSYGQNATASAQVRVVDFSSPIIVTSYGLDSSSLSDLSIGTTVLSGGNVLDGSIPLGDYNYHASASNTSILLRSLLVNGNIRVLNYTNLSLSAVSAPANRSAIYLFYASNFSVNYASAQVTINYSDMLGSVVSEPALEIWTCQGISNCASMSRLVSTIDAAAHTVTFSLSDISGVYGLYNPARTISTPINVPAPSITRFTPSLKNAVPGTNITIYLDLDLGANLSYANVALTPPSGPAQNLANESFSEGANHTYSLTYSFIANETGDYALSAMATDMYGQNATANYTVRSVPPIIANIASYGVNSTLLADPAMDAMVLSGAENLSGSIAPGNYTLYANASSVGFTFSDLSVEGDLEVLSFSELGVSGINITPPSNRTFIYFFDASNYSANFSSVQVAINYTDYMGSVISELALEVWTCHDLSNCTLARLPVSIDQTGKTATFTLPSLSSIYVLCQASSVVNFTQTITQYVPSGGSSSTITKEVEVKVNVTNDVIIEKTVEVPVNHYTTIRLLSAPDLLELHPQEKTSARITLSNAFSEEMGKVTLNAQSSSPDVEITLDSSTFEIPAKSSVSTIMHVQATKKTGTFGVLLAADAPSMDVNDKLNVPIVVSYNLNADKELAEKNVNFAKKLLAENPECRDLTENLLTAASFINGGLYAEADSKAQSTISGCSGLIALRGKPTVQTQLISQLNLPLVAVLVIVFTSMIAAFIIGLLVFRERHIHRSKKENSHHTERKPDVYQRENDEDYGHGKESEQHD